MKISVVSGAQKSSSSLSRDGEREAREGRKRAVPGGEGGN